MPEKFIDENLASPRGFAPYASNLVLPWSA
jgi:hypothetical protein